MGAPRIADKYDLLRRLGRGGMAEVFLAKQKGLEGFQKLVVIKRILPHRAQDGEFVTMFLDEARTAADLRHPNVVNVFDINRDLGTYYMAMEFLHGSDVRGIMKRSAKKRAWIPTEHVVEMVMGAAAGLHYAHEKRGLDGRPLNIVHRDISPQNIIVGFTGETKIVDFGIAKAASQQVETEAGVLKGKFAYMSPEQVRGEPLDGRSDLFALGIVLWELLTLRRLFKRESEQQTLMAVMDEDAPPIRQARPELPKSLEKVVAKALARDLDERYQSCEEFREALEECLAHEAIAHSPARLGEYVRKLFGDEIEPESALGEEQLDESALEIHPSVVRRPKGTDVGTNDPTRAERRDRSSAMDETKKSKRKRPPLASAEAKSREAPAEPTSVDTKARPKTKETPRPKSQTSPAVPALEDETEKTRDRSQRGSAVAPEGKRGGSPALFAALGAVGLMALLALAFGAYTIFSTPSEGTVIVRTTPRSARLLIDGVDTGEITPHMVRREMGSHLEVVVEKDGFVKEKRIVEVKRDTPTTEVVIELEPLPVEDAAEEAAAKGRKPKRRRR